MKIIIPQDEAEAILYDYFKNSLEPRFEDTLFVEIEPREPLTQPLDPLDSRRLRQMVQGWVASKRDKIQCIKDVKILTGWGLKDSKDFVEDAVVPF